ncbi:MAG: NAD-dependent epimerase/dehydratase family protein [Nitrospinae bacterium]|nr:NAD-dependent epimerase/dehydratase family protein [Nitrospinota bacterium]
MRVLVTGGGGFLGGAIVRKLHERGDRVRVLGRRKYPSLPEGVESMQADLRDREAVFKACEGRDAVFHAAAVPGIWGDRREFFGVNVEGTRNVIDACLRASVKKLVFTSSPSVVYDNRDMENVDESVPYPRSYLCDYPRTKAIAERMVVEANGKDGLRAVSLRPHLIWGPGDPHLIPRILERAGKGQLVRVGDGRNKVDLIYIDNAALAHVRACDFLEPGSPLEGKCYFVSDGQPVVLWDWIGRLLQKMGIPPVRRCVSYRTAYAMGALMETVYKAFKLPGEPRMTRFLASQLATSHYFDIARARRDFHYEPEVGPEEGMERLIRYLLRARPGD